MKLIIVVITDVITPKTSKRRFIEVRGLFCYDDTKYKIEDVINKAATALKQYAEEKGYDKSFVENFFPKDYEYIVGVEDIKDVKECPMEFEFEVCDKKYNREGGYVDSATFPKDWEGMSDSEIRKIVHNYVNPFYMKGRSNVGDWRGYSELYRRFDESE